MELAELLNRVTSTLERLRIPYLVTGSVATIAYGEPRLTNDIDLVVRLLPAQIQPLCDAFPESEFYISAEVAMDAVEHQGQFNILHPASGLKIDVMIPDDSEFNHSRFRRLRQVPIAPGVRAAFASPEDVILKKLEYFREGGSDKHLRDIAGVLKITGAELDHRYVAAWADRLGLAGLWREALEAAAVGNNPSRGTRDAGQGSETDE